MRLSGALVLVLLLLPSLAVADAPFVKVIQPGAEPLAARMLLGTIAGCKATGVALDRTRVVARYACPGAETVIELHHPGDAAGAVGKTAQFAIVPGVPGRSLPPGFLAELTKRLTDGESGWRWVAAEAPGLGRVAGDDAPTPNAAEAGFTAEQADAFVAAAQHYRHGKYSDAFDAFVKLARQTPRHGVLGMLVASLASTSPDRARADALAAAADADTNDVLAQFVAGVAAHYCGHRNGRSVAEKQELYRKAITYLSRARPSYDFEPRLHVYLGVSHFRLGRQKEAEQLIEAAVPLAQNDPDVYYCRAEIFQRADVKRSIADIEKYLAMTDTLAKQGVPVSEDKHARVKAMLEYLKAVARGERPAADDDSLFDPVLSPAAGQPGGDPLAASQHGAAGAGPGAGAVPGAGAGPAAAMSQPAAPHPVFASSRSFALGLGVIVLGAGLLLGWRVLRRRSG